MEQKKNLPLFETRSARGRVAVKLYAFSMFVGIYFIFAYRVNNIPSEKEAGRWAWIGLILAELWFSLYWFITVSVRWNPTYRYTYKDRLNLRYKEELPRVDIFVCTADPKIEPPIMVINTVLSMMAYDYPPEKTSIYLSDDGGSELTFYALLEASNFSKKWLPFCEKFKVEPRSPEAYFRATGEPIFEDHGMAKEWCSVKKSYDEMKGRIQNCMALGRVPEDIRKEHKGFLEWNMISSRKDHQAIVQILIDGRDPKAVDIEERPLPTIVYLAREKRPQYHHKFKAGAINALIRVSSKISNAPIILTVDCDMYSNNSQSIRDVLCFFMDEDRGHQVAYVQFPQAFANITKNDLYANSLQVICNVEIAGFDGNGGPCYIGTGCFHRRESICGLKYTKEFRNDWKSKNDEKIEETASFLEKQCKVLASCTYEENTQWGKETGLKYGCPLEDNITGLAIQCRGWKSIYFTPERIGFLGVAPTTLLQTLVQHKRWSEGYFQIFASRYCPLTYGHNKIPLKLQLSYCLFALWAVNTLSTLYYVIVPSVHLLRDISLFPKISNPWVIPFAYVILANSAYGLIEFLLFGGTLKGWWNDQRMWLFKRTTSYLFGLYDSILKLIGFTNSAFVITVKVVDEDVSKRYEQEVVEFGADSPMFTIIATLALLNALCLLGAVLKTLVTSSRALYVDSLALQIILCSVLFLINIPVYQGLFFRVDKGRMPTTVTKRSILVALLVCSISLYFP